MPIVVVLLGDARGAINLLLTKVSVALMIITWKPKLIFSQGDDVLL